MIAEKLRQDHSRQAIPHLVEPPLDAIGLQPLDSLQSPLAATLEPAEVIFDGGLPSSTRTISDARLPQDLHPDWTNEKRMREQVMSRRTLSEQSLDYLFTKFTGYERPKSTLPHTGALNLTMEAALFALGGLFATRTGTLAKSHDKLFYPKRDLTLDDFFEGWKEITASALEKIIALSKSVDRKSATLMGGGLPDTGLIREFSKIWSKAMRGITNWSSAEINDMFQYPSGPGGALRHREIVIERYLGVKEKAILTKAHHGKSAEKGLWFTNGSQEALRLFAESLIKQYNPSKSKPIEIVITDPTYPGFLLAIDKYLKSGVIRLRPVPIDKDGRINLEKLDEALEQSNKKYGRKHAKVLYLAEGNPMPKPYANLKDVARLLRNRHGDALVLEDRAYKGLGLENQDALIYHLPQQVLALETVSKSASPGEGLGSIYGYKN